MRELPKGWKTAALEELCERLVDGSHNPPQAVESGKPMLSARNINDFKILFDDYRLISGSAFEQENARTQIAPGDVLLTIVGTIGRTAVVTESHPPFALQRSVAVLKPREIDARYLAYALNSPEQQRWLASNAKGTAQKGVYLKTLGTAQIPIAPAPEQTRIVAKLEELLSDLDAGVAELKAAQKKLAQYRQSLLKAAVEGTLTTEWRQQNRPVETGAQLLERILAERRARWEAKQLAKFEAQGKAPPKGWQQKYPEPVRPDTTDLPELPEGWVWASLGQLLAELTSGSRDWAPYYDRGSCIFVMAQNVRPWRPDFSFKQYVDPPPDHRDRVRSEIQTDDLLVTIVGANTGQVCRIDESVNSHFVCQSVALLRPVLPGVSEYMNAVLNSEGHGQRQFREMNYGAGRPHLSFDQLESVIVPLPPLVEQVQILEKVVESLHALESTESELSLLFKQSTAQRQNILRAAFSGQLVPQDPADEPASALLERIRAERVAVKRPRGRNKITRD